jgi:hypothetical protein
MDLVYDNMSKRERALSCYKTDSVIMKGVHGMERGCRDCYWQSPLLQQIVINVSAWVFPLEAAIVKSEA